MQLTGEPGHFHHGHFVDHLDTGLARRDAADDSFLAGENAVGQIRFHGQGAGNTDQVGGAAFHRLRHGLGRAEAAGDHQRYGNPLANGLGVVKEVGFPLHRAFAHTSGAGHGRVFIVTPGDFQQIQPFGGQGFGHGHGFFFGETTTLKICRVEFDAHRVIRANGVADSAIDFQRETHTVFQGAAPFVVTTVMVAGQELADQISVGAMDLDTGKAGLFCQCRAGGKAPDDIENLVFVERPWRFESALEFLAEGHRGRRQGIAAGEHARDLFARVVQLHPDIIALALARIRPAFQQGHVALVFQHHVSGLTGVVAVDHDIAGNQQPGAALGPATVESLQRRGHMIIDGSQRFAHGGFGEAILQRYSAGQGQ